MGRKSKCIGRKASSKNSKTLVRLACSGEGHTIAGEKAKVSCCQAVFVILGI